MPNTRISRHTLRGLVARYDLGDLVNAKPLTAGSVQTNLLVTTTQTRVVLRLYENRSAESVRFELAVVDRLVSNDYPYPAPLRDRSGTILQEHAGKPLVLFTFLEGRHVEAPNRLQRHELFRWLAELHRITHRFSPSKVPHRWNYGPDFCLLQAIGRTRHIGTRDALDKLRWYRRALKDLVLPASLRKGICHTDLHYTNILYRGIKLSALLDFDDANYTYQVFDIVGLVDGWAWRFEEPFDLKQARKIVSAYQEHRRLTAVERRYLFDVYKLSILIDCLWFYERGSGDHFYEQDKIEWLDSLGRDAYREAVVE